MGTLVKGTVQVADWSETAYVEVEGQTRLARAVAPATFAGALEGEGQSDWLLAYPADGSASFVGLQNFEGALEGRAGSFVLQMSGTFDEAGPHVVWSVVPGSGTGDLVGLSGAGGYDSADFTLDYTLG
jgi:hypothetical protein